MAEGPETSPDNRSIGATPGTFDRAGTIFLRVRELDPAAQDAAIDRLCTGDSKLRDLVSLLLRGDRAPLPAESLADEIRAAQDIRPTGSMALNSTLPEAAAEGSTIDHYRVLERIGEGGFGMVYMAEQERPVRRRVALKIVKLGMDTKQVVARFEAERQALALMDHPNIAKVFDAGATESGRPYFVMELVRGEPITDYCDHKNLSIPERLALMVQVCEAIQHAHQRGVIHRDIKPSNVLVSTIEGNKPSPKIIDFGIAKATSARLTERTVFTEFRQMIGTPEYMSPEQAGDSAEDVDTRTDVYATGVLLYELLTGATPFDSRRLRSAAFGELQRIIREEDPPKPSTRVRSKVTTLGMVAQRRSTLPAKLSSAIQGELDWIVMKAMDKDRARRYESAGSMAADIQRYLTGHAVHAAPPGRGYLVQKFVRRNKGAVIAGSLVAVALVVGLVGTSLGFFNAERQRKLAVAEREVARQERTRADGKAADAIAAETLALRGAYSANVLSACGAIESNQFAAARAFLDAAPEHLRGWEWHTLRAQLDTSTRSLPCPMSEWKPGTSSEVYSLIPHPDGRTFFTTDKYQSPGAQRWDISTGALVASFLHIHPGLDILENIAIFALAPDAARFSLATGAYFNAPTSDIASWDLSTGQRTDLHLPATGNSRGVIALHPDGRRVVRRSAEDIWIEDAASGSILAKARPKDISGNWAHFSGDGARVAVMGARGEIEVFDTETLTSLAFLTGHRNLVHGLDFSPGNHRLATAAIDGTAQINDLPDSPSVSQANAPSPLVLEHSTAVENIRFSPDGRLVATSADDRAIRVWDVSNEGVARASTQTIGRRSADFLAMFSSERLFAGPLMFTTDGRSVAGREIDGAVRFWDLAAFDAVKIRGHKGLLNGAKFAPRAGVIVSVGWDGWKGSQGCVRIWDAETGEPIAALGEPGEVAYHFDVSTDGTRAALSITMTESPWSPKDRVFDHRLDIVDLTSGRVLRRDFGKNLPGGMNDVAALAFHPTGELLAIGRLDTIEVVRADTGEVVRSRSIADVGSRMERLVYSHDGRFLVATVWNLVPDTPPNLGLALLLDAGTLEPIRRLDSDKGLSVAFTPDCRHICFGSHGGVIRVFDVASGERVSEFKAHTGSVTSLDFNADASRLASVAGNDGDVTLWDTSHFPTFERVARFHSDGFVTTASWFRNDAGVDRLITTPDRDIRILEPVPIRTRVQARADRREALTRVRPRVADLFAELHEPATVAARLMHDATLTDLQRRAALQLVLQRGLAAPHSGSR